jgi:integrase
MGYGQRVRSPKGTYWLGRYLDGHGSYATVKDGGGRTIHYSGKRDAKKAADAKEAEVREHRWTDPDAPSDVVTFGEWANLWYASLDLAVRTMENYRDSLELHILPRFQHQPMTVTGFLPVHVDTWEKDLRADGGYSDESIRTYRGVLSTCLEAAVPALIPANPAYRKPNRGRRTGKKGGERAAERAEKVITSVLGGILIAERMSILSGRDDEFVMTATLQHGLLRLGECVGLERQYSRPGAIRVEWQLCETSSGQLIRSIPKDGSRGTVVIPPFLAQLHDHLKRTVLPAECPCHGQAYLFRGLGRPKTPPENGVSIRTVAEAAGVSAATVSNVLTHPGRVAEETRQAVEAAAADLGWIPGAAPADPAWHWRRSALDEMFTMAASGRFPRRKRRAGLSGQPVPVAGEWPGTRLKGSHASRHAEWCWLPVAEGMTPHGARHSGRTWMEENGVHHVLAEAQMRHELGGNNVYRHVTEAMRADLRGRLQEAWDEALQRRGELAGHSPVTVVEALLRDAADTASGQIFTRNSQERPARVVRARR